MSSFQRNEHLFSQIPRVNISRSKFDRSHNYKTAFDSGCLVPFFIDEVLPGDTMQLNANLFGRLATPAVPFMDNVYLETFFFFVPNRLVWEHWQNFNGEQKKPSDSTDFIIPSYKATAEVGSLADYLGIPTGVKLDKINALPFRALCLIWNEWFRDENLQDSIEFSDADETDGDGIVKNTAGTIQFNPFSASFKLKRGKRHDYFTSCLPWPQKGPGVELPLGEGAPVVFTGFDFSEQAIAINSSSPYYNTSWYSGNHIVDGYPTCIAHGKISSSPNYKSEWVADLSSATAATINSLREAFQLQRLYERDARGGTRYTEILRSHFGVVSPDARLQRPEYLGGSSTRININPVQQTSSTDSTTPQGNLAAFGVLGDRVNGFTKSFVEHGYIIGLVNVRADLTYQQGLNRMWSRRSRFDFYWPALAHLGEQAVLNKEIYAQGTAADEDVFGYQERWSEYRYYPSMITGKMRSTYAQSLDVWHLAQKFTALPTLSASFIEDNPPLSRVLAVQNEPQILLDVYFNLKSIRPMPVYSVPGLIDHF